MPTIVAMAGYTIGGLLILYGIVCMFVSLKKIWEVLMSIRLRSPIFRQLNKKSEETKVYLDENCIMIEGNVQGLSMAVDKLNYLFLGVING